eukprot:4213653-Pleurochrysis_carterae.AAC.3
MSLPEVRSPVRSRAVKSKTRSAISGQSSLRSAEMVRLPEAGYHSSGCMGRPSAAELVERELEAGDVARVGVGQALHEAQRRRRAEFVNPHRDARGDGGVRDGRDGHADSLRRRQARAVRVAVCRREVEDVVAVGVGPRRVVHRLDPVRQHAVVLHLAPAEHHVIDLVPIVDGRRVELEPEAVRQKRRAAHGRRPHNVFPIDEFLLLVEPVGVGIDVEHGTPAATAICVLRPELRTRHRARAAVDADLDAIRIHLLLKANLDKLGVAVVAQREARVPIKGEIERAALRRRLTALR